MYATMPVYYPSFRYAREHDETDLWRESHRVNMECQGKINRRALEAYNSRELDLMIDDLIRIYGLERTMCVLSRTIQYKDWDERLSQAVRKRAKHFSFSEQVYEGNDPTKQYICHDLHSCILDEVYRKLMEKEAEQAAFDNRQQALFDDLEL
ncbi:DUF3849 domain-containing protein [Desulfosporosinus lacus]|uniref:DUF3849 domain-containing protein n=1 Tax=Desulfosporosinus lacus DSM 15449 TaxID=1121420 RepID=A0A1M5V272_9FIRM|nr:DUF3849 domain-containing protein [Desulfosporosinus lacus]SHH69260.1 Protein of unknown function [Desulfosporosinus lacus DSM 15449]